MSESTLKIEEWEDRSGMGEKEHGFGYVYFNDNSRVGFALNVPGKPDVWEPRTNGGGQFVPVTHKHLKMAANLLKEKGYPVRMIF